MSEDLYILPPSLKSCEPIDSADARYLNQYHVPIVNPIKKTLNIVLYNENYLTNNPKYWLRHLSIIVPL